MRNSIRWSLIAWFSGLLTVILAATGWHVLAAAERATWATVDAALDGHARAMLAALEYDDEYLVEPSLAPDGKLLGLGWELDLSPEYLRGLTAGGHYALWAPDGRLLRAVGVGAPATPQAPMGADQRRVVRRAAGGVVVVVGRSVAQERAQLAQVRRTIVGTGMALLSLALLGGWWIARRSVQPIEQVAAGAAAITADDLSARLDTRQVPSELRGVVEAFNATLDRLEAAFARQTRFTADASHELRTPVTVIRTQAELALKRDRSADDYRETIQACLRAAERMTNTVEGLLTLARADGGAALDTTQAVSLAPLVAAAVDLVTAQADAEQIAVSVDVPPEIAARGDRALLAEVVQNLLTNAIRYNRTGGTVTVTARRDGGHVALTVADTGLGIPAEALPHLFERFYRVDPARSRERGGSGLGLAIVHWIVGAHGGAIDVQSTAGEGSTFTVRLPTAASAPLPVDSKQQPASV